MSGWVQGAKSNEEVLIRGLIGEISVKGCVMGC